MTIVTFSMAVMVVVGEGSPWMLVLWVILVLRVVITVGVVELVEDPTLLELCSTFTANGFGSQRHAPRDCGITQLPRLRPPKPTSYAD